MKATEYGAIDKSDWPEGPWKSEPDKRRWIDEETGYPCLIERNPVGTLFGYVGVPPGHPAHGMQHLAVDEDIKVHGGLTFGGKSPGDLGSVRCGDKPESSDDTYWFGFN